MLPPLITYLVILPLTSMAYWSTAGTGYEWLVIAGSLVALYLTAKAVEAYEKSQARIKQQAQERIAEMLRNS